MKRASTYLFIGIIVISLAGCANKSLDALKDLERENQEGLIALYDEALERQYRERKSVEGQFIDLQSKHTFLINAYIQETDITPDDIQDSQVFSISEIETHESQFHQRKTDRWKEIDASYNELVATIDERKNLNLQEEVERIEGEREETGNIFVSGLKKIGEIFGKIF